MYLVTSLGREAEEQRYSHNLRALALLYNSSVHYNVSQADRLLFL